MNVPADALLKHFDDAAKDLSYPSETDAPFVPFAWETMHDFSIDKLLLATRHKLDTPVDGLEPEDFFAPLTRSEEWHDDTEKEIAAKFTNLHDTLKQFLSEFSVYRVGIVDVDIYLIGKTADGYYAGVSTKAVET